MADEQNQARPIDTEPGAAAADKDNIVDERSENTEGKEDTLINSRRVQDLANMPRDEIDKKVVELILDNQHNTFLMDFMARMIELFDNLNHTISSNFLDEKAATCALNEELTTLSKALYENTITRDVESVSEYVLSILQDTISTIELSPNAALLHDIYRLRPQIEHELKKPEYSGRTIENLCEDILQNHNEESRKLLRSAIAAAKKDTSISVIKPTSLDFSFNKMFRDVFTKLAMETADKNSLPGQLTFSEIELAVESKKERKNGITRTVTYSIRFDDFKNSTAVKALDDQDRRVYDAVSTLYACGNRTMTISTIFKEMTGRTTSPSDDERQKIKDSLLKLSATRITFDQSQDYGAYTATKRGTVTFKDWCNLLYIKGREAFINGKYTDEAIYFLEEPILYTLAKDRNQVYSLPLALLDTGKSHTNDYLAIENYLIDRIIRMKNKDGDSSKRIRYSAIFELLKIPSTRSGATKKGRVKKTIYYLLDHYKKNKWIAGYKEVTNVKGDVSVEIIL